MFCANDGVLVKIQLSQIGLYVAQKNNVITYYIFLINDPSMLEAKKMII